MLRASEMVIDNDVIKVIAEAIIFFIKFNNIKPHILIYNYKPFGENIFSGLKYQNSFCLIINPIWQTIWLSADADETPKYPNVALVY